MPSIDERVVSMAFENQVFEQRVAQTMGTLSKLDVAIKNIGNTSGLENIEKSADKVTLQGPMSALDKLRAKLSRSGEGAAQGFSEIDKAGNKVTLEGPARAADKVQGKLDNLSAGSTFSDIEKASNQVELGGLTRALDVVTGKFSVLQGVATVALGNITSQAVMKGGAFAKSFAFGPLTQGFDEYKTNLSSIQTILANTEGQQVSGLDAVKSHLDELNTYSDQTIYNFSEMAKNIGTFTAAGVDLDTSTQSIKGIANLAALSGSNSQQASTAMYQLSQAIAAGRVGLQDWNSVVNAGMGGAVFQKSLIRTAVAMGKIPAEAVKIDKATGKATVNGQNFRNSIMAKPGEESWLTSDVLTTSLKNFTGDMKEADLIAQGFTKTQAHSIMQQAATAKAAATEVKNLSQVFDIARETIGSGWSKTFQLLFGDFEEAKKTFTELSNFINGFINRTSTARNQLLAGWAKLGGRDTLIEGIKTAFSNLLDILGTVKDAFRQIFPPKTSQELFDLTKSFSDLMTTLTPSPELLDRLQRIFAGLFAVVDIGWTVIKELVGVIADLLGVVGKGSGGFLEFVAGIGDWLVVVKDALVQGGLLHGIFQGIGAVLKLPIKLIGFLAAGIGSLFGGNDVSAGQAFEDTLNGVNEKMGPLNKVIDVANHAWDTFINVLGKAKTALEPWFSNVVESVQGFAVMMAQAFKDMDFDTVLQALQTGFIGGIFLMLKKAFGGGGLLGQLSGTLGGVNKLIGSFTGKMEAMQSKLHAEALLAIAGAIAVLAAGLFVLSKINGDDLQKALVATAVGLGELMGAMKLMTSGMGKLGILQLPVIAAGMIGLAVAVVILAGAMKIFATMSWEDIGKGLTGVAGALVAIAAGMALMPPTLPLTAAGLILIGVALNLIAAAIGQFGGMKWEDIGKGLFTVVDALGLIALTTAMMPPTLPATAAGLILMGIALSFIAGAIKKMGELDFATILKGLGTMAVSLGIIAGAMALMPPGGMIAVGAGLILVGLGLTAVGKALEIMGGMSVWEIVKGLIAMGGAMTILAVGLTLMIGTLPGSAALAAAAVALAILAPTLAFLGTLKFSTIFKGLAAIALVLGTLALVGAVAAAPLSALGVAMLPLAAVFVVTAGAVFLFAKALSLLGGEGGKGVAVMVTALTAFVALIPTLVIDFVKGLVSIVDSLKDLLPKVVVALGVIIDTIIAFVIENAPKLAIAIGILVDSILQVLLENTPKIIAAGIKLLNDLLNGVSQNIGQVTTKVSEIIIKFMAALTAKAPALAAGGLKLLAAFLSGVASNLGRVVTSVGSIVVAFINAVARQLPRIALAGVNLVVRFLGAVAKAGPQFVTAGTKIILDFMQGVGEAIPKLVKKGLWLAKQFLKGVKDGLLGLTQLAFTTVIDFMNGIAEAIRKNTTPLIDAGKNILDALIDGMAEAVGPASGALKKAIDVLFSLIPGWAKKILGIKSPSKVFMEIGKFTMMGFAKGVEDNKQHVQKAATGSAEDMIDKIKKVLGIRSPSAVMEAIGEDTIRGFANGIRGSSRDITAAFKDLNSKLTTAMKDARSAIKENEQALAEERAKARPDAEAIQAAEAAIAKNEQILRRASAAHRSLTGGLVLQKNELVKLTKEYNTVVSVLDVAKQALDDAKRARDDAKKSLTDKFNTTPTIDDESEDKVRTYVEALRDQVTATQSYTETLAKLRAIGLDDKTYQKLLDEGLAGKDFAESLLAGGQGAVESINKLDAELLSASTTLAQNAATALYQAGVDAAQGLVNGLRAKRKDLEEEMDVLARRMVMAIKRQLRMKSPSQVFVDIGRLTMDGLAKGIVDGGAGVQKTMTSAADTLVDATKSALGNVPSMLAGIIDMDPTITPVLDLSSVKKDAKQLGDLTNVIPITAAASYGQANATSQEVSASQQAAAEMAAAGGGVQFSFEQNNTSPKALDDVEIYRQTKNQLSQVKEALGLVK